MLPEESHQAHLDLKGKIMLPIHWGKFDLSTHAWTDPINRLFNEAEKHNTTVITPLINQTFDLENLPQTRWWEEVQTTK